MLEVHVLASGSDGNCTVIESDGEAIMIDAGISCRKILKQMEQEGVDKECIKAILLTHEHSDHVSGAGATARKLGVPIMCNQPTFNELSLGNVDFVPFDSSRSFDVGQFHVTPLPTMHNAVQPNAFFTEVDDKKVLLATDTGTFTFPIMEALKQADIRLERTAVGDRYVLENMLENGYVLGGEQSGHVIFLKDNTTGDGIMTALHLMQVMTETGKTLAELADQMQHLPQVLVNVKCAGEKKYLYREDSVIMDRIAAIEGLLSGQGRVLVRPSGTEALVRVMLEGPDEEVISAYAEELACLMKERMA